MTTKKRYHQQQHYILFIAAIITTAYTTAVIIITTPSLFSAYAFDFGNETRIVDASSAFMDGYHVLMRII